MVPIAERKRSTFEKAIVPALTLIAVVVVSIALYFYGHNPARVRELENLGYLGAFLISLIGNASILLPGIALSVLTGLGVVMHSSVGIAGPILVGIAGGVGAALGEVVGYMAGASGRSIIEKRQLYARLSHWVEKWGSIAIFGFTLVPLFFDLVGIAAGALRFPLWKFILVCWVGRTILYVTFIVLAALGWQSLLPYFG